MDRIPTSDDYVRPQAPEPSGANTLIIAILAVGIAVIAGAMWYLADEEKRQPKPASIEPVSPERVERQAYR